MFVNAVRCCIRSLAILVLAAAMSQAMSLEPRAGDAVTQTQLFAYLFTAPQPGDWLRYRLSAGNDTIIFKTVGFGAGDADAGEGAYIEMSTVSIAVFSAPAMQSTNVGGALVWKMYVDADDFNDSSRLYSITNSAFKIGDGYFRLRHSVMQGGSSPLPVSLQTLLWAGLVPLDDRRTGVVRANRPQDLKVRGHVLHCSDVIVDFKETQLPAGGQFPYERIEVWQSPDVPLGSVRVATSVMGRTYHVDLIDYGRGDYRPVIDRPIDRMAAFPGSL